MITIKKEGILLSETDLEFETDWVLNPAIMQEGNIVNALYLVLKRDNYSTIGYKPPIETEAGWFLNYYGVHDTAQRYIYSACAALLDLKNPKIEITRLPYPLFKSDMSWELSGYVNNVVIPTKTSLFDDRLDIYYGAANKRIAVASVNLDELTTEFFQYKI